MSELARRPPRPAPWPHLSAVASVVAGRGQPEATFRALDAAMNAAIGHRLYHLTPERQATGGDSASRST